MRRFGDELVSTDPGDPDRVVAVAASATAEEVSVAVAAARAAFGGWAATPATERAAVLPRAAAWMRERRYELAALVVCECGKPWREADADVCEAIDFCEYYARGAMRLARAARLLQVPGERNDAALRRARRRGRDRAVELPAGDHRRHDGGGPGRPATPSSSSPPSSRPSCAAS